MQREQGYAWAQSVIKEMQAMAMIAQMMETVHRAERLPLTDEKAGVILKSRFRPDQTRNPNGQFAYEGGGSGSVGAASGGELPSASGKDPGKERIQEALREQLTQPRDSSILYQVITDNHFSLAGYSPKTMKEELEAAGYTVRALGNGNYKGIRFEDGGGYRANFGGDGIFQYHPEGRSHHKGAYWKIQTGKGRALYDMDGNEKKD